MPEKLEILWRGDLGKIAEICWKKEQELTAKKAVAARMGRELLEEPFSRGAERIFQSPAGLKNCQRRGG